jgi:hypothetical protein
VFNEVDFVDSHSLTVNTVNAIIWLDNKIQIINFLKLIITNHEISGKQRLVKSNAARFGV